MRQQINLYQPVFSSERKLFGAGMAACAFAAVILALAGYTVHARVQLGNLENELEDLRVQQQEFEAQAAQSEERAARGTPTETELRIKNLSRDIAARTHALQMLQSGAAGQTTGFASRLEALARRHVDGLWIDAVILSGANGSMSLAGATLDADFVPRYLQNLAQDPVLNGTRFDDFLIERPQSLGGSQSALGADGENVAPKSAATPRHIRFRAGTRALYPAGPEPAT